MGKKMLGILVLVLISLAGCDQPSTSSSGVLELNNVSYDPTRELYEDLNQAFLPHLEKETGKKVNIQQSHGGSGSQARKVIEGNPADVVTLALWSDIDAIRQKGLIGEGWEDRLPNRSLPYFSTIVFVVRKGNPKGIKDWPDLIRPGVEVVTPNPKVSGNGRLSFLGAWGAVRKRGGTEEEARSFVTELYRHVQVLDNGARACTLTFARKKIGDVHLTWENEAFLEVEESKGEIEIVAPPTSIKAEPYVAVVDANVDRRGTRAEAEAYLKFLYTPQAQEIIGRHHYRPFESNVWKKIESRFPKVELFPITSFVPSWGEAHQKFFSENGIFDQISKVR